MVNTELDDLIASGYEVLEAVGYLSQMDPRTLIARRRFDTHTVVSLISLARGYEPRAIYTAEVVRLGERGKWGVNVTGRGPWNNHATALAISKVIRLAADEVSRLNVEEG